MRVEETTPGLLKSSRVGVCWSMSANIARLTSVLVVACGSSETTMSIVPVKGKQRPSSELRDLYGAAQPSNMFAPSVRMWR